MVLLSREIHVDIWKSGRYYIAYCPVLDIASQGGSRKTALGNLVDALRLHAGERKEQMELLLRTQVESEQIPAEAIMSEA